jgi:nitrogen regulatory protein P-II 2
LGTRPVVAARCCGTLPSTRAARCAEYAQRIVRIALRSVDPASSRAKRGASALKCGNSVLETRAPGPPRRHLMKLVIAIVKPNRLEEVRQALSVVGVKGLTVTEVKGYGRQKGHTEIYRGAEYKIDFTPKVKIEVAIDDAELSLVLEAIRRAASTGKVGDGKVFVLELLETMRIRTGETGSDAL